ncbi:MAG: LTA synthase family protein [Bacteroidetes bacterium]|nr:LTA synthase family protein [Bacteroidota bacterium]
MQKAEVSVCRGASWRAGLGWAIVQLTVILLCIWLLSTAELFWLRSLHGSDHPSVLLADYLLNVTVAFLEAAPLALAVHLAVLFFSPAFARWVLRFFLLLLLAIHLGLTAYFATTSVPLGADIYGYSWSEIRQTVGSAGLSWRPMLIAVTVIAGCWVLLWLAGRRVNSGRRIWMWLAVPVGSAGIILLVTGGRQAGHGGSEFARNLVLDKTAYFARESWNYWRRETPETDIYADNYLGNDGTPDVRRRKYIAGSDYPFLTADSVSDVLSPFFRRGDRPPNLVVLLVEGLGRAFANEDAYLGNFTPFLDSLARESLYWDNFLSAGGRTFAALPSVLGSLPFANNGYLALGDAMPPVVTLNAVLQTNGYHTSYYYGGDAGFDNMALFLRHQKVDVIKDAASFPAGYVRLPSDHNFSWGYSDSELFRWWLSSSPAQGPPELSVLLTLSMHSPFRMNDPAKWNERFERRLEELGFDETQKRDHRLSRDQYMTILYSDDALRNFMAAFARRPDYANTVFLITGDHRMPEIPMRDKIDRFHVPLLIYSPLLQRRAVFHSVSTHLDITPSLLAWLHHSYGLAIPSVNSWVGDGLDTMAAFRNIHRCALMQTKTDLVDFVAGEHHLNNGEVFRLHPDLSEDAMPNDSVRTALQEGMDAYRGRNGRWMASQRLWPDSVIRRFLP